MALPIITADQRLREKQGVKLCLLYTSDAADDLYTV